jgi:hypothetical protein
MRPDGGPAFPLRGSTEDEDLNERQLGISVRDWFAGHAPPAPTHFVVRFFGWPNDLPERALSWTKESESQPDSIHERWKALPWSEKARMYDAWPYAYADQMLAQREKE